MATRSPTTPLGPETKVRDTPTPEAIEARKEDKKATLPRGRLIVKTKSPGYMWDPEAAQRIDDVDTVVKPSRWLDLQIKAKKITKVEG